MSCLLSCSFSSLHGRAVFSATTADKQSKPTIYFRPTDQTTCMGPVHLVCQTVNKATKASGQALNLATKLAPLVVDHLCKHSEQCHKSCSGKMIFSLFWFNLLLNTRLFCQEIWELFPEHLTDSRGVNL